MSYRKLYKQQMDLRDAAQSEGMDCLSIIYNPEDYKSDLSIKKAIDQIHEAIGDVEECLEWTNGATYLECFPLKHFKARLLSHEMENIASYDHVTDKLEEAVQDYIDQNYHTLQLEVKLAFENELKETAEYLQLLDVNSLIG